MIFYTYIWKDANGTPFYVGKGKGKRYVAANDNQRSKAFMQVYTCGGCVSEIMDEFIHESEAFAHEMELIQLYGRREFGGLLVNATDGGEGASGWVPNSKTRFNMGKSNRGKKINNITRIALIAANTGRVHTSEEKEKRRIALLGRKLTDEWKRKIAEAHIGKRHSKDHVENNAIGQRMRGPRSGIFKGVCYRERSGKWRASIISKEIGTFTTSEQAARAYDKAAIAAWGIGNCYLNFPNEAASYVDIAA